MLVREYDAKAFSDDVVARWGHLSEELAEDAELLHVQMGHLGRLCVARSELALDVLRFLDGAVRLPHASSEIENAIAISFLDWPEVQALGLADALPGRIRRIIEAQWEGWQQAGSGT